MASKRVVEGPMAASCSTAFAAEPAVPPYIPTTVVSTKESKGSDSQMNVVVEQNNKSVRYDGTTYSYDGLLLLLVVSTSIPVVVVIESTMSGSLSAAETEEYRRVALSLQRLFLLLLEDDTDCLLCRGDCGQSIDIDIDGCRCC
jgi:hypothetical protein